MQKCEKSYFYFAETGSSAGRTNFSASALISVES